LTLAAAGWWFNRRLNAELVRTEEAHQHTLTAKQELQQALVQQVAERLDSDLREVAVIPHTLIDLLAQPGGLLSATNSPKSDGEARLESCIRTVLARQSKIFGICFAFEPFQFDDGRADFAMYIFRRGDSIHKQQLLPPIYVPIYRQWDWYRIPYAESRPSWSEPYVDPGADHTPMVSYSVPINRNGKVAGVVTADLSIQFFRVLHDNLQKLNVGRNSYSFIISRKGTFIYHPNSKYEFPSKNSSLDTIQASPDFIDLVERMRRDETGRGRATDFTTGRPATFLFTRIPSAGWDFVVANPDLAGQAEGSPPPTGDVPP
jgi:hypothetical protein